MENIKSYLDGELDLAQQTEVETHLRNDSQLQKMVEDFKTISDTLRTAEAGEPYGFDKLQERLQKSGADRKKETQKIWRIATYLSLGMGSLIVAAMIFPVFAQSKVAAKASSEKSDVTASAAKQMTEKSRLSAQYQNPSGGTPLVDGAGKTFDGRFGQTSDSPSLADKSEFSTGAGRISGGGLTSDVEADKTVNGSPLVNGKPEQMSQAKGSGYIPADSMKKAAEPETPFKSQMRDIRDKNANAPVTLNDTPHGIYLERTGEIRLQVEDLLRSVDEVTGMVQGFDGFVVNNQMQNTEDGGSANMVVRVPTKNYSGAMNKLRNMGKVLSENGASQDITSETVDSSTRMISWADEEDRLVKAMDKAKTEHEKNVLRREIAEVRVNLNAYRAQVKSLTERSQYSTITVDLLRGDKADQAGGSTSSNWSGNAFKDAKSGLGSVGQVLGVVCIYALVFTPVWLPFAIAAYIIRKKNLS
ncbi:MAG: DUF4349 domain-containing protein [Armatimonadetes bacterium]|nr:DUF4349 domain-containing protein [Armatimonadota bacterium]